MKDFIMRLPKNSPLGNKIPFGGITSNILKLIAVILMLSDHIWATAMSFGNWMTYIGRMAFPIFAFLIAEGFVHTSNFKKYAMRLLGFAIITEIPFNLFYSSRFFNPYHQNVLFTLLLGLLAIYVIDNLKKNHTAKNIGLSVLWLALICIGATIGFVDYGFLGMITVVMFYLLRNFPFAWLCQLIAMVLINIVFFEFPLKFPDTHLKYPLRALLYSLLFPYGFTAAERVVQIKHYSTASMHSIPCICSYFILSNTLHKKFPAVGCLSESGIFNYIFFFISPCLLQ